MINDKSIWVNFVLRSRFSLHLNQFSAFIFQLCSVDGWNPIRRLSTNFPFCYGNNFHMCPYYCDKISKYISIRLLKLTKVRVSKVENKRYLSNSATAGINLLKNKFSSFSLDQALITFFSDFSAAFSLYSRHSFEWFASL